MDYFSDLEYDIQEMYIDGLAPDEIAYRLKIDIERVIVLLTRFGVDVSDYGTEPA
jgi:DNA-binding CsgD family transcriptional regulator